jgi:hypothetical protein
MTPRVAPMFENSFRFIRIFPLPADISPRCNPSTLSLRRRLPRVSFDVSAKHRRRRLNCVHATIGDIAAAERINPSYASRVLRLTLLAPEIVEAILDGR